MSEPSRDFPGLRRLAAQALRLGPWGAAAVLTVCVAALATVLGAAVAAALGGPVAVAAASAAICALVLTPPVGVYLVRLLVKLEAARRQLALQATHDELTGLANRRHFVAAVEREWSRCQRYGTEGALLLVDADHFGALNDSHGRACGDALLRQMARTVAQTLRPADLVARFGGEQFAVFLPHTDPLGALDVAERLRVQLADLRLDWQGVAVGTSVSIGVAVIDDAQWSLDALLQDAERALQAAKEAGRNCVRTPPVVPVGLSAPGSSVGDRRAAGPV
ncbi:MAG: GGDEF domain-containing protein [Burkholderiaceae bacterium]|jgi:diguanylate cyclase (GGDEF)-like protein|nr:GGDEF domain-containing protein [Burkholderiaceae bacterium]